MINESSLDFEESTIMTFEKIGKDIKIVVKKITDKNDFKIMQLILFNVKSCKTEADTSSMNLKAEEDGELIFLELTDHAASFGVNWNNYIEQIYYNYEYEIEFDYYEIKFLGMEMD